MAHPKVEQDELLEKLFEVFREFGYDGASLSRLSETTGLKKASLYHRFPNGKEQMVESVLDYVDDLTKTHVVDVLLQPGDPAIRLQHALDAVSSLYADGKKACLLRALSTGPGFFRPRVRHSFALLIKGFQQLATDLGHGPEVAQRLAESVVAKIQGSLVLAGAMQDHSLFKRALAEIQGQLLSVPK